MNTSQLHRDFRHIKFAIIGLLAVFIFTVGYNTFYTAIARRDCYHKAREAMGLASGQPIVLSSTNGQQVAASYSGYFDMCMSKEYGLAS